MSELTSVPLRDLHLPRPGDEVNLSRDGTNGTRRHSRAHDRRPSKRSLIKLCGYVLASSTAIVGATAGVHPTGNRVSDSLLTAIAAGVVVYAGGFAKRWASLTLSTTVVLLAQSKAGWCLAGAALGITSVMILADRRSRLGGHMAVALAVSSLLLGGVTSPERLSAGAGMAACALILPSSYAASPRKVRRRARRVVAALASAYGIAALLYALTVVSTRRAVNDGFAAVQQGIESARAGDRTATIDALRRASDALHRARGETQSLLAQPALGVPGLGPNAEAVKVAIDSGARVADDALAGAVLVDPELLRPRAGQIDVKVIRASQKPLARIVSALENARDELSAQRSPWLLPPVSRRLDSVTWRIENLLSGARTARDASVAAPELLGANRPTRYLVLFVTPVESRGSGFPGNYAQLDVSAGHMSLKRFGRTRDLIASPGFATQEHLRAVRFPRPLQPFRGNTQLLQRHVLARLSHGGERVSGALPPSRWRPH